MNINRLLVVFIVLLLPVFIAAQAPRTMNAAEIQLALKKLGTLCSVMHIAAHPDDENTALLAYLANERLCRTAYLSLTRGEGGQNLIGSEKGALLGVIRTQELLAARRIDGAEQIFTRAIDFGFSKTAEESLRLWNKQEVLADVVWAIRKFRPDVIITRFPPDERAGHGHHIASAILAEEAFKLAGDAKAFPEQLKFVSVWQPKRLLWNAFVRQGDTPPADAIKVDVGTYNPLLGKSYTEIAGQSRSMHKSQGFGAPERRGSRIEYLTHVAGEKAINDIFDSIDTSWKQIDKGAEIQKLLDEANVMYKLDNPSQITQSLINISSKLDEIRDDANWYWIGVKEYEVYKLISSTSGFFLEAVAEEQYTSANDKSNRNINLTAINRSDFPISIQGTATGYRTQPIALGGGLRSIIGETLKPNQLYSKKQAPYSSENLIISQPYWLAQVNNNYLANISDKTKIGLPEFSPQMYIASFFKFGEKEIDFETPVVFKFVDRVEGEIYRPFVIAPPVVVNLAEPTYVYASNQPKPVRITVRNYAPNINGVLKLNLPSGWRAEPSEIPVALKEKGSEITNTFTLTPAANAVNGKIEAFVEANGQKYANSHVVIDYPHIPQQNLFPPAESKLVKLDVKTGRERIGYIMGSGDEIPEALKQIGYNVRLISDEDFETLDFAKEFDTIIAGIRAYNTRNILRRKNQKLLDFVQSGGRIVVQYNTNDNTLFANFAPFPLKIGRERVTVEEAPVKFLQPAHSVLNFPNKITDQDFAGWTQERGLYFASEFDANFTPVLAMNDPNEKETTGSLVVAKHGKGEFIYTGISFFRQLPAGVPGAYRLFVNLISTQKN
jgi:LmbE family N-acetylglucosaminyl deacetylase